METTQRPATETEISDPKRLTLEAIFQDKIFDTKTLREPHWMRDSQRFSYLDDAPGSSIATLWLYNVKTGKRRPVLTAKQLRLPVSERPRPPKTPPPANETMEAAKKRKNAQNYLTIHGYQWSPDESQVLFARSPRRRSSEGDKALYVYTLATKELKRIVSSEHEHRNVKWSPDGRYIGYVRTDEIFVYELATGQEIRLTDTASATLYNGRFGWVYEEELAVVDGWAWSPNSRSIAYYQQDESQVPEVLLTDYDDLHLSPVKTRYPKAGDPNPTVKIGVIAIPDAPTDAVPPTRWMDLCEKDTSIYGRRGFLIPRMQWTLQGDLIVQKMPRLQNGLDLLLLNPKTGKSTIIFRDAGTWIDLPGDLTLLRNTEEFLTTRERGGFRHLWFYTHKGMHLAPWTSGDWEVDTLIGVDEKRRVAYFTAAKPNPMERQIFSVPLDDEEITRISQEPGTHSALFSPDFAYYLDTYSSHEQPPTVRLHRADGELVSVILENPLPKLEGHSFGKWEFQTFMTDDGVTLNACLLKPADFDPAKRYPVLIHTYGGPGSQVVRDNWGNGSKFEQYLAQQGILSVLIDGRGSGGRGSEFKKIVHKELGKWEVHDQIEGAKWLGNLPYVDAERIGIWGWSYGGYMASLCILRGADVFKAAAAVAPVTHWELYDSIYTERYMQRPQDNPKGYANSTPLTLVDNLKGAFLLIHGTADDNVHFQNAARLASELQKRNKPFEMMVYPGKKHGIEGVSQHVFQTLAAFFLRTL